MHPSPRRPSVLELFVGVLALGVVATFVMPRWFRPMRDPEATVRSDMNAIAAALETYRHDMGRYPSTVQGLAILCVAPADSADWFGPYIVSSVPADPWGRAYIYKYDSMDTSGSYVLMSYGADGKPGGSGVDADVTTGR